MTDEACFMTRPSRLAYGKGKARWRDKTSAYTYFRMYLSLRSELPCGVLVLISICCRQTTTECIKSSHVAVSLSAAEIAMCRPYSLAAYPSSSACLVSLYTVQVHQLAKLPLKEQRGASLCFQQGPVLDSVSSVSPQLIPLLGSLAESLDK